MEVTYNDLLQLIIQREMGILGPEKTHETVKQAGLNIDNDGNFLDENLGFSELEKLIEAFHTNYGPVTVMGCKIAVLRLARQGNLELPKLLS